MSFVPAAAFGSSSQTPKWCYDDTVMLRTRWSPGAAPAKKPRWKSSIVYFRQRYEHQFVYDWPTMEKMLLRAGFAVVYRSAFGQGRHCLPIVLDDKKYEWESLYVEALKS